MSADILIIEDDVDFRKVLKLVLESEGYDVAQAENGQIALDFLQSSPVLPQLIILDLMMPVMDGFQFRTAQDALPSLRQIPVIVMSADGHMEEKKKRTGAHAYLKKPADIDEILSMAKKFCRLKEDPEDEN